MSADNEKRARELLGALGLTRSLIQKQGGGKVALVVAALDEAEARERSEAVAVCRRYAQVLEGAPQRVALKLADWIEHPEQRDYRPAEPPTPTTEEG